jgi:hypothetical protein
MTAVRRNAGRRETFNSCARAWENRFAHDHRSSEKERPMTNTPRDQKQNQNPADMNEKSNVNDPNRQQDNDGARRQQEAEQARQGQQGEGKPGQKDQNPQQNRPDDKRKPQQS